MRVLRFRTWAVENVHWLHLFSFSQECVLKCLSRLLALYDEKEHWLHLWDLIRVFAISFVSSIIICFSFDLLALVLLVPDWEKMNSKQKGKVDFGFPFSSFKPRIHSETWFLLSFSVQQLKPVSLSISLSLSPFPFDFLVCSPFPHSLGSLFPASLNLCQPALKVTKIVRFCPCSWAGTMPAE